MTKIQARVATRWMQALAPQASDQTLRIRVRAAALALGGAVLDLSTSDDQYRHLEVLAAKLNKETRALVDSNDQAAASSMARDLNAIINRFR